MTSASWVLVVIIALGVMFELGYRGGLHEARAEARRRRVSQAHDEMIDAYGMVDTQDTANRACVRDIAHATFDTLPEVVERARKLSGARR